MIEYFLYFIGHSRILNCEDLHGSPCKCQRKCLQKLTLEQIKKARQRFTEDHPTFQKERQFILNWFADNEPHPRKFVYTIFDISVCWKAWVAVLGKTKTRFYLLKRDFNNGRRNPDHGLSGAVKESMKSEYCRNFLEKYFKEFCDYLPNSSTWYLTSSSKKCEIYEEMKVNLCLVTFLITNLITRKNLVIKVFLFTPFVSRDIHSVFASWTIEIGGFSGILIRQSKI